MRKIIFSVLLASVAATPAMAAPRDDRAAAREERQAEREKEREDRREAKKESSETRKEPVREEAPARVVHPDAQQHHGNAQPVAAEPPVARQRMDRRGVEPAVQQDNGARRDMRQQNRDERQELRQQDRGSRQEVQQQTHDTRQEVQQQNREGRQDMFQQRREQRSEQRDELRAERVARQQALRNVRPPVVSNTPRPGTQPPPAAVRPAVLPAVKWSSNHWRKDKRYDWNRHRNKYWWLFQLGSYYDPFGWGYQPYQTGWRMWPSYYSSNYWINDPYYYRLPYAPRGTRWVRYWDDAVLVDTWSGQVVDVIYNFFW